MTKDKRQKKKGKKKKEKGKGVDFVGKGRLFKVFNGIQETGKKTVKFLELSKFGVSQENNFNY